MLIYKKGEQFICKYCDKPIFEFTKDLHSGDIVMADHLKGVGTYPDSKNGDSFICKDCGNSYGEELLKINGY